MLYQFPARQHYRLAQITDCHLLANADGWYQQVQPAKHLQQIVQQLLAEKPDAVLLTGDLTQDHSQASYQLLADIVSPLACPVFVTPGNHDDPDSVSEMMQQAPFRPERSLLLGPWLLALINTKSNTPAGCFTTTEQTWLQQQLQQQQAEAVWLFCHHHPRPLQSFIDKHGQQDAERLWQTIAADARIRGIAHGHAHYAYHTAFNTVQIVGCPASSVQFAPLPHWQTYDDGPQWCDWYFSSASAVHWQFRRL